MEGAIKAPTRLTPGWKRLKRNRREIPLLRRKGIWKRNWVIPPKRTPKPKDITGSANRPDNKRAQEMMEIFRSTGARAGVAKCFREFKTPMAQATRPIKKM
jgi:hypothetical protein